MKFMQLVADLHCHSRHSDGTLDVGELFALAASRGVRLIALTDHDELSGLASARQKAAQHRMQVVSGVEISTSWAGKSVHVVGLRIDEHHPGLLEALRKVREERGLRAKRMDEAFEAAGISGVLDGARSYAPNRDLISRTHFARYLVDLGICANLNEVFTRFMKPGKPGYVPHAWMPMTDAIALIHAAGGRAVLAHPARFDADATAGPEALVRAFANAGGDALEVVCAAHRPPEWAQYGAFARKYGLLASTGSDFHSPTESRVKFGDLPLLSPSLTPVWHDWPEAKVLNA